MDDNAPPEGHQAPPDGYAWTWVPSREVGGPADDWETVTPDVAKRCRWSDAGQRCPFDSVARLNRSHRRTDPKRWWHYCEAHMFGRRIRRGQVECCILTPLASPLDETAFS